jgi:hypothetical protein
MLIKILMGVSKKTKTRKRGAFLRAVNSGVSFASVFGEISPKTKSSTVITRVAIPTPFAPNKPIKSAVASADAVIFTILLPINTVERTLSKTSSILSVSCARLLFSARFFSLIRFIEEKAISHAEKKAEKHSKTKRAITRII